MFSSSTPSTVESVHISSAKMLISWVFLGVLATGIGAAVAAGTMPDANPGTSLSTFVWPRCGRNRLTMPYHGGVYGQAYQKTGYARLGCNHDASVSEMFHAFALKHKDDPDRLR